MLNMSLQKQQQAIMTPPWKSQQHHYRRRFTTHLSFAPQDVLKYTLSKERLWSSYPTTI
jgi:hypothetical protein